eukprot:5037278-Prymnesium_polylepis.2
MVRRAGRAASRSTSSLAREVLSKRGDAQFSSAPFAPSPSTFVLYRLVTKTTTLAEPAVQTLPFEHLLDPANAVVVAAALAVGGPCTIARATGQAWCDAKDRGSREAEDRGKHETEARMRLRQA